MVPRVFGLERFHCKCEVPPPLPLSTGWLFVEMNLMHSTPGSGGHCSWSPPPVPTAGLPVEQSLPAPGHRPRNRYLLS